MKLTRSALAVAAALSAAPALAAPAYTPAGSVPLGAPDRWDYVVADSATGRVYVAHGDRLAVIDGRHKQLIGQVEGIPGGTHGTGLAPAAGRGFTDDGKTGAVAFNMKTLKVIARIPTDEDADAIATDRLTGHIFIIQGDPAKVSVIDPKTDKVTATIEVGEKMEYAASDQHGTLFVAGVEKGDLIRINARTNKVTARWATPGCTRPHGLAVDHVTHRAFMGCANSAMVVVDTRTGKLVANLPIGRGNDAVAFDGKRKRVFSSNGADGTISVYQQRSADRYDLLETITTAVSGRTMDVDSATGRLFVAAADVDPPAQPGGRPKARPGTLRLLMFDPAS